MAQDLIITELSDSLENEIRVCFDRNISVSSSRFREMLEYQLGWTGEKLGFQHRGKQVRPILLLLACKALEGDWKAALPAAVAVELIHNFSLIHDDIQDNSRQRRGRETVWVKFGAAQAINAGDAMLVLANQSGMLLTSSYSSETVLNCMNILNKSCLMLTNGQYLDLAYGDANDINLDQYWQMIKGKTGALLGGVLGIGALLAGNDQLKFQELGVNLGKAFQVQDDWLGIWGEQGLTGKSVSGDLMERKKTFPVLYALSNFQDFRTYWESRELFDDNDIVELKEILARTDTRQVTRSTFESIYDQAKRDFDDLFPASENTSLLREYLTGLLNRAR